MVDFYGETLVRGRCACKIQVPHDAIWPDRTPSTPSSQCPFCKAFILKTVVPLFSNGVHELMTFRYIAWGNAKYDADQKAVYCQHGSVECDLNILINCAQVCASRLACTWSRRLATCLPCPPAFLCLAVT